MRAVNFFDTPTTGMGMSQHHLAPAGAQQQQQQHSTWRSPVPYLFGGLAAMMGLIAFALLLLACSYWRLSGYLEEGGDGAGDLETAGGGKPDDAGAARISPPPPEQRIVVIMAGDEKPTFLATPVSSRASSFGDNASRGDRSAAGDEDNYKADQEENRPETAAGGDDVVSEGQQEGIPESQEDARPPEP